jgi:hypothetical protein
MVQRPPHGRIGGNDISSADSRTGARRLSVGPARRGMGRAIPWTRRHVRHEWHVYWHVYWRVAARETGGGGGEGERAAAAHKAAQRTVGIVTPAVAPRGGQDWTRRPNGSNTNAAGIPHSPGIQHTRSDGTARAGDRARRPFVVTLLLRRAPLPGP